MEYHLPAGGVTGWLIVREDHVTITVRLTPGASTDTIGSVAELDDGQQVLAVRVRAVAEKGRANTALTALIAKAAGRPKSACRLVSGATGRRKVLRIEGEPRLVADRLSNLAGG